MQKFRVSGSVLSSATLLLSAIVLTGCGVGTIASPTEATQLGVISGSVHGGRQPIVGGHIYILEAGNTGYASGFRRSLLSAGSNITGFPTTSDGTNYYVTTNAVGAFSLNGGYTCDVGSQVYLYSEGGDPGAGVNSATTLIALLGQCPAAGNLAAVTPFVNISEVSTVAAAYATAGFGSGPLNIGSPDPTTNTLAGTNIANAFAAATNLFNVGGTAALTTTPAGNGTVPQSRLHTLANILASCVNSTGPGSSPCLTLFANAKTGGTTGTAPTEVATAAFNLAHNPGNATAIAALFPLQTAQSPYKPSLSTAPNDLTIGIGYTAGGLGTPRGVAVDASGNIWIANSTTSALVKLSTLGAALSGSGGFTGGGLSYPVNLAIDSSGSVWLANYGSTVISRFSNAGVAQSATGYGGGGLNQPQAVAFDGLGNLWTASTTSGILYKFSAAGALLSPSGYTGGGLNTTIGIAVDGGGNIWAAGLNGTVLSKFTNAGTAASATGYSGAGLNKPASVTIDATGNAWSVTTVGTAVSEFSNTGTPSTTNGYTGGGVSNAYAIATDGAGNQWIASGGTSSISEFSNAGVALSPAAGFTSGNQNATVGIAVDGSGNVWASSFNNTVITELVGAATPVITPIVAGLPATANANGSSNLGTRP